MKQLYDGTLVPIDTPTKMTSEGRKLLTPTEISTRQQEEQEWQAGATQRHNERQESLRKTAYQQESDPIFFEFQRGDATEQDWLNKIEEIKQRYPYQGD